MTSPRALLTAWNIRAKKQLGQNFLNDANVARAIVNKAGIDSDDVVLEIGPGRGALTARLLERFERVLALEVDERLRADGQVEIAAEIENLEGSSVPIGVVVDESGQRAFVAHANADVITEIDLQSGTIVRPLTAGKEPDGMGWSPVAAGR